MAQGLVRTTGQLQALRFLLGMFEAGFVPGCAFLIGSYYTRNEFLKRYACFFASATAASAVNGVSVKQSWYLHIR